MACQAWEGGGINVPASAPYSEGGACAPGPYRLCDGTQWRTIETGTANGACSISGAQQYDTTSKTWKVCDNPNYIDIACAGTVPTVTRTAKGTAQTKTSTTSWTALSSVSMSSGDALLVCVATKGESVSGVTWNGTGMTLNQSASSTNAKVYIYSLPNASAGTGNIVVTLSSGTTDGKALTATSVSNLMSSPFDQGAGATGVSFINPNSGYTSVTRQADEFIFTCIATNGPNGDTAGTWALPFGITDGQRLGSTGGVATTNMTASDAYMQTNAVSTWNSEKTGATQREWAGAIATYRISIPCTTYGSCSNDGQRNYVAANGLRWCNGTNWLQMRVR